MKSLMVVSLVSAFLYAGLARAEDPVSMLSNNPEEGVTKLKFMDGKIATVNGFLGEIEVPGSDGTVYHVSFEDAALEAASGDPALADQIVADMVDFSTNPQNLMTITPSIVPRVARSWEPPGGGGGTTRPKLVAGSGGIVANGQTVPDLGGPCDLSPCSPFQHFDGRITYILDGHSGSIGSSDVVTQLNWLDDKKDWSRWQLDQCQAARDTSLDWAVTAPALYACGAVATGVGAVVCGAAIAAYIIYANRYRRQSTNCTAPYPGPGNW